eukprot:145400-Pelagomonas_calceolata.AAC.2
MPPICALSTNCFSSSSLKEPLCRLRHPYYPRLHIFQPALPGSPHHFALGWWHSISPVSLFSADSTAILSQALQQRGISLHKLNTKIKGPACCASVQKCKLDQGKKARRDYWRTDDNVRATNCVTWQGFVRPLEGVQYKGASGLILRIRASSCYAYQIRQND